MLKFHGQVHLDGEEKERSEEMTGAALFCKQYHQNLPMITRLRLVAPRSAAAVSASCEEKAKRLANFRQTSLGFRVEIIVSIAYLYKEGRLTQKNSI